MTTEQRRINDLCDIIRIDILHNLHAESLDELVQELKRLTNDEIVDSYVRTCRTSQILQDKMIGR